MELDPKTRGAWLVHHTNKLQQVTGPNSYDNILVAGKAGILLSALSASADVSLPRARVGALASAANINKLELQQLLKLLSDHRLINVGAEGVDVLGVTNSTVLTRTSEIFEGLEPAPIEQAALGLSEVASREPVEKGRLEPWASDTFKLSRSKTTELFDSAEEIGFIDSERVGEQKLYFNGNLFRREDAAKIVKVLGTLNPSERRLVSEVEELLRKHGCLTHDEVEKVLGVPLLEKLNAIAMYDISVVSNDREDVGYITRPAAFDKYGNSIADDALDLAKALVASLTYGMTRRPSTEGRITVVAWILGKLIRGEWIGPATAIAQDYQALEVRGVVETRAGPRYGAVMRLLKREVGEMALAVLRSGDTSERSLPNFGGLYVKTFSGPESTRETRRRKQRLDSKRATANILTTLRTGGAIR